MMQPRVLSVLLLLGQLSSLVSGEAAGSEMIAKAQDVAQPSLRGTSVHGDESVQFQKLGELRKLQADSFFPADDPYWNPAGIMERKPCIPFEAIRSEQIENPNADETCATNSCGGGCCRAYNWLLCDEDSSFAYVSCVCNENTIPPEEWTKAPTVPRPTSPTPPPTFPPTTPAPVPATGSPTMLTTAPVAAPPPGTDAPTMLAAPALQDIVDTAVGAGSFTTLVDLVTLAGLGDTLKSPGPFTVFAPTDEAFAALDADTVTFLTSPEGKGRLTEILTYHVVPGTVLAADLSDGLQAATVQGGTVTFSGIADGTPQVNGIGIVQTDIMASNGVIHVINGVLIPPEVVDPVGDSFCTFAPDTTCYPSSNGWPACCADSSCENDGVGDAPACEETAGGTPLPTATPSVAPTTSGAAGVTDPPLGASYCTFAPDTACYPSSNGWPACCADSSCENGGVGEAPACEKIPL